MRDPGRHAWTFPQAAAEASDLLPPAPFDALSDPSVDDLLPAGLALWPRGAAWGTPDGQAAATDTVLAGFTRALLLPFADLYRRAYGLTQESRALTLADSLADWEADFGLPDECVAPGASGAARRRALLSRVRALATITPQDFVQLAAQEGFDIAIEEPATFECGFSECGGAHSAGGRLEQVYWIVHVYSLAVDYFTCGTSECGADRLIALEDVERLQCLFRRLAPGWSQPVYVIHETTGADALMAGHDSGVALDFLDASYALRVADEPDLTASGPLATLPGLTFSRASAATRINAAGDMESVGPGVLRYDHDPVTLAPRGVLLESARTDYMSNRAMAGLSPGAAGTATVPGAPTGWSLSLWGGCAAQIVGAGTYKGIRYFDVRIFGTNAASYAAFQIRAPNITTAAGVNRILSLNLSQIAGTTDGLALFGCTAMLDAYVGGSSSGTRGQSPEGIPSGDFAMSRIVTSVLTTPSGTGYITPLYQVLISPSATVDITLRVGRWQVEDGKFASSFVGTTTSGAATRAADALAVTLPQALDAAAGLTIAVRARAPDVNLLDPNNQGLIQFSSPDFADRLVVYRAGATNRPTYLAYDGGALVFAGSADATPNSEVYRVGMRVSGNTLHVMRNGVVGAPIALSSAPSGLKTLHIGSSADQHIQSLVVIPSAVSDADFAGLLA